MTMPGSSPKPPMITSIGGVKNTLHPSLDRRPWIVRNAEILGPDVVKLIRRTMHITDMDLPRNVYRALIWSGHRYAGEFCMLPVYEARSIPGMDFPGCFGSLHKRLRQVGIDIGAGRRQLESKERPAYVRDEAGCAVDSSVDEGAGDARDGAVLDPEPAEVHPAHP